MTTKNTFTTTSTVTLNIGGVLGNFIVITLRDTIPNNYTLITQNGVQLDTWIESNLVTVEGIDALTPISIVGGEFRVNENAWTSVATTVGLGDTVRVRIKSPNSFSTIKSARLDIGTVTRDFTVSTTDRDTTPDNFTFLAVDGAELNREYKSEYATITGINAPATISIYGGEYSINGGIWNTSTGVVVHGDIIQVRLTSSLFYGTGSSAIVNVGGYATEFKVNTKERVNNVPDAFIMYPMVNQPLNTLVASNIFQVKGINLPATISIVSGEYSVNGGEWTTEDGYVYGGDKIQVRILTSNDYSVKAYATLNIGGVEGVFSAKTIQYTTVTSLVGKNNTLNSVASEIESFFKRHLMIESVIYSDDLDFKAIPDLDYRAVHINPMDINTTDRQITYRYSITIADRQIVGDGKSEFSIQDDATQIAEDFITYFTADDFEVFDLNPSINIQRFSESNTDRLSGVTFNVNCSVTRLRNKCAIPLR